MTKKIFYSLIGLFFVGTTIVFATGLPYYLPAQGGLGTNQIPTSNQVPLGNAGGTYTPTAVTSLGLQPTITLTTSGSSGASTLSGNVLNIPQYSGGGGGTPGGSNTQLQFNNSSSFGGAQLDYAPSGLNSTLTTPNGTSATAGGTLNLTMGNGGSSGANGGSLNLTAGNAGGPTGYQGGDIFITAGHPIDQNTANPGGVFISDGATTTMGYGNGFMAGNPEHLGGTATLPGIFSTDGNGSVAFFDAPLPNGNETFGFPSVGGTLCITATCLTSYEAWTHPTITGYSTVSASTTSLFKFQNASTTGLSANYASFGGTASTTFFSSGKIGVNTLAPISQLANTNSIILDQSSTGIANNGLAWDGAGTGYSMAVNNSNSSGNGLLVRISGTSSSNKVLTFDSAGTDLLSVLGNGQVGIGVTNPAQALEVNGGAGNGYIQVDGSGNIAYLGATYFGTVIQGGGSLNDVSLFPGGWDDLTAKYGGNVGIGTTSPDSTLDTNGSVKFEGSSYATTTSLGGGALLGGACSSVTTTITSLGGYASTTAIVTTPQSDPGDGFDWNSIVTSKTTIKTRICAEVAGTPNSSVYNLKIIK